MKFRIVFAFLGCSALLHAQGPRANKPVFRSDSVPLDSQQIVEPLKAVCRPGVSIVKNNGRVDITCPVCPANSASYSNGSWRLTSAVFGHFVTASSNDVILFADGCESHQANFGGSFLLTRENGIWKSRGYYPGVVTAWTRRIRMKDGRDVLISQDEYGMGGYVGAMLSSVVFTRGGFVVFDLVQLDDHTNEFCVLPGIGPTVGTAVGKLISARFPDLNQDHVADVSITVHFGNARFTPIQQKECASGRMPHIAVRTYTLDFLLQGDRFVIAPWSKETNEMLDKALRSP